MFKKLVFPCNCVLLFLILTHIAACGGGGTTTPPVVPPGVQAVAPANGTNAVALNSGVSVIFSEAMDAASITTATFTLRSSTGPVAGTVAANGTSAVFRPTSPLLGNTAYTATITRGAKNSAGIPLAADFTWSFTTGNDTDVTPPIVSSTNPAAGATGVLTGSVSAVFSETMDPTTINAATFRLSTGGAVVAGKVSYSGTAATFTPDSSLLANTTYTATITGARDLAGNPLPDFSWSFTRGSIVIGNTPRVITNSPSTNATNVAVTTSATATFSTAMDPATVTTTTFKLSTGGIFIPGTVTLDTGGTLATFKPTGQLASNTTYTATITNGAKSTSGIPLATTFTWSFTTGISGDTIPPTVVSTAPAANATGVSISSVITATFSEALDTTTVNADTITVSSAAGSVVGTVTLSGTTATFTPNAPLAPNTSYTVSITSGIKDLAGNALIGNFSWSFTTGAS